MTRSFLPACILFVVGGALSSSLGADPAREGYLGRRDGFNDRGKPQSNMEAVEAARDRGAGRIVDEDTWTLDRIDAAQDRRNVPGRDAQLFDQDRDRQLRIERRVRDARNPRMAPEDQVGLETVPGDLAPRSDGASPLSMQLYEDDRTLAAADEGATRTVRQLDEAEARELKSLRDRLDREGRSDDWDAQSARIRKDYAGWRAQAQADRNRVRSRVLGQKPELATTRPAKPATEPSKQ